MAGTGETGRSPPPHRPSGRYHHGDARNALIAAAAELLETVGAAGLSLRQVAEHAGLSRQAPYNHFADKEALLAELAREGFLRLSAAMAATHHGPRAAMLERAGDAYIAMAQAGPALFRLMFSRELVDLKRFPAATAAASAAFGELVAVVASFAPEHRIDELSLAAWCIVHGYAMISIETSLEPPDRRAQRARLFARIIQADAASDGRSRVRS